MNIKLVESIAQVVLSLSEEERSLLYDKIKVQPVSPTSAQLIQTEILNLENRLKLFESQYQMSSE